MQLRFMALLAVCIFGHLTWADDQSHMDIFHLGDANNDTSLSSSECLSMWKTFDVDKDDIISKLEFIFKWTFLNLQFSHSSPHFFRMIDVNFDRQIDEAETKKICEFFDDDEDGDIVPFEFDFNWKGLFSV